MPQGMLPFFPNGVTQISEGLAFAKEDGKIVYFNYQMPVFSHAVDDHPTFQMITSQFCVNGNAKQADIIRAFGVTVISMKRAVKKYREGGPGAFYKRAKGRGPSKLTTAVIAEAQRLLNAGVLASDIAEELNLKPNTVVKAICEGKLMRPKKSISNASLIQE